MSNLDRYRQFITMASQEDARVYFPFSLIRLNDIVGDSRGIRSGRFIQLIGDPSAGKTTLSLDLVANAQRKGIACAYVDFERTFDKTYAATIGVQTDSLFLIKTDTAEEGMNVTESLIKEDAAKLIVIDSIPAAVPSNESDKDMLDSEKMAVSAGLWTRFVRRLVPITDNHNALVVMINQYRANISTLSRVDKKPYGARQIGYQSSLNIELARISNKENRATVQAKATKNKLATERGVIEFDLIYGEGLDVVGELISVAVDKGIVAKRGAWYELDGVKANGVDQCKEKFNIDDLRSRVLGV